MCSWSELTGQEMDVGVYKWKRSQGTGTGGGGGLRASWTDRGGTEDQRGEKCECVLHRFRVSPLEALWVWSLTPILSCRCQWRWGRGYRRSLV